MFFANRMHRELFLIVFFAALIPALITAIGIYYLIFNLTAKQLGFPEAVVYNLVPVARKVTAVLAVATPLSIAGILIFAHRITHRIIGPFDRIVRELDECVLGVRSGPIMLRRHDKFWPLVHNINKLLAKLNEYQSVRVSDQKIERKA
jgi:hypothetical protein